MNKEMNLNKALAAWANTNLFAETGEDAASDRMVQHAEALVENQSDTGKHYSTHHGWRFAGASVLAASVAAIVLFYPTSTKHGEPSRNVAVQQLTSNISTEDTDAEIFTVLYTPTNEEEYQL